MYDKLSEINKRKNHYNQDGSRLVGRNNLLGKIKKKMTTLMIGALAAFEEELGELWAHGVSKDKKDNWELNNAELWEVCRQRILDLGNLQIRAMEKELENFDVEVIRYYTDLKPNQK